MPKKIVRELEAAGSSVPPPINTMALVDTGASNTCILPQYARMLGLISVGTTDTLTAAGTTAKGESVQRKLYEVCVTIGSNSFDELQVLDTDTVWINVGALIGRDILAKALMVCNGPDNTFTLGI